jgi:hypothetical protein
MPNTPIRAKGLSEPISHYTDAVVAGPAGPYISPARARSMRAASWWARDITAQTRKTLDNMKIALAPPAPRWRMW